jgi:UDP:flavonoid glycosyltransferase YjiC (YdhE family)
MTQTNRAPKIVLATFGTHGDLHPFLALALALQRRGARAVIAAAEVYRAKVEAENVGFERMRPDLDAVATRLGMEQQAIARAAAQRPEFIVQDIVLPHLHEAYEDAMHATRDADMVVTHSAAYGAKLAAEKRGLPHIGIALQPMILMSAHDPPMVATLPRLAPWIYQRGPTATRAFFALGKLMARRWSRPIEAMRRELGLPKSNAHPLFEGQFTKEGAIALFSPLFGPPQPDHPPRTSIVGFAFYDSDAGGHPTLAPELQSFLAAGPAPLVFTQGTSAVQDAEHFIRESLAAIRLLKARAVLVLDAERAQQWATHASQSVLITGYAPYSLLFPRAHINIHHGGVGTTAQALRAGRPQLIAPYLVDQPDNAARVVRLGAGRTLELKRYAAEQIATELRALETNGYGTRAEEIGKQIATEDGASAAAEIILRVLDEAKGKPRGRTS